LATIIDTPIGYTFPNYPVVLTPLLIAQEAVLGSDPLNPLVTTIWVGSAVEPTIAVNPVNTCRVVAAWQQQRINNGGAVFVGVAFSSDGGVTWTPSQTVPSFPGLVIERVSDVVLSYSLDGATLYLVVLYLNSTLVLGNGTNQAGVANFTS
jgi:hypothetical protein